MINNKTTAVRLIPAIGKKVGDTLDFGGLLGYAPVMPVNQPRRHRVRPSRRPHARPAQLAEELAGTASTTRTQAGIPNTRNPRFFAATAT